MKRRTEKTVITVETFQRTVVRLRRKEKIALCEQCAAEIVMLAPNEAAAFLQTTAREIFRLTEAGEINYFEKYLGGFFMSFDIFAAGTDKFHYERNGCEDGSTFEFIKVVTILQGLDVSSIGKGAISGTGGAIDYAAPGITDVMIALATQEMLHNLSNAVCFLAMNSNSSDGWIYVHATETNTFWVDTVRSGTYRFSPGDSPGAEFVSAIGRCLKDTGLDNFGVLQLLSIVLSRFSNHIDDSMTPKISISLTN